MPHEEPNPTDGHREGRTRRLLWHQGLILLMALGLACSDSPSEPAPEEAVFEVLASAASGERFRVLVQDTALIAEMESLIGQGNTKIVSGRLRSGDGGFNNPWSWHLEPGTVELAEATIELCDGRPSDVESNLDYWINTVQRFCPWGSEIIARVR